jgi:alpha-tubulin suppressor-like RCC1 family protein
MWVADNAVMGIRVVLGSNNHGQVGDGTTTNRLEPTMEEVALTFVALAAGWDHTCGLDNVGRAYCWGSNDGSQLGDGTTTDRLVPTPVWNWPP